jgi:DNA polymerase-3 subunit beta
LQITVNSQALASELRLVNKVVPPKPAIAILSHVLITAEDDVVKFYATDIEIGLLTECPAKVADKGMIVLPCAKLLAMVEQFPDADVSISTEANKVIIRCEAFTSRIQSLSALDFPQMPSVDGTAFPLDGAAFIKVIGRTRYAISGVSSKYVLQGALLTMTEAGAALVATDSKRLALATMERESDTNYEVIFPAKTLDLIVLQGEQGPLEVLSPLLAV